MSVRTRLVAATAGTALAVVTGAGVATAATTGPADADAGAASSSYAAGRVLVQYRSGVDHPAQAAVEHAAGATHVSDVAGLGVRVLSVPAGAEADVVQALTRSGKVVYAERDGLAHGGQTPNDTYWPQQWGPAKMTLPAAWDTTTGASSVTIALLDTGVDLSHPDLQGRFTAGYDYVNNDATPADDQGHGTATAGILGARTGNTAGIAGACWTCTIMPIKVLDSSNWGSWSWISSGITYATDHGARVISMSIYGTTGSTTLQNAVKYAHDRGVLVAVAAGNDGTSTPSYPGSYAGAFAVGGTDSSDRLYSWSDSGSWVDVAAPGCDYTTRLGGGYWSFCGTSAATPLVAGLAGLLLSTDPTATVDELEDAIEASAVPVSGVAYGRVDAARALVGLGETPAPTPTTSPSPSPSPTASRSPAPSSGTTTLAFSGSTAGKGDTATHAVSSGSGTLTSSLSFSRAKTMTLQLVDAAGAVLQERTGSSPVSLSVAVPAGSYQLRLSSAQRSSYSVTATVPAP